MTQREAESAYGTLRRTINYKIKNLHKFKIGRPMTFSSKEEKSFVGHIIIMSNYGFPIDKSHLRHISSGLYLGLGATYKRSYRTTVSFS